MRFSLSAKRLKSLAKLNENCHSSKSNCTFVSKGQLTVN
uniref:Uncharacterized protein n=1 Tax=Rhizophora mucronata TaxID=61149 RepID=A0A2P2QHK6_RHIMU